MKRILILAFALSILTLVSCSKKENSIITNENGVTVYINSAIPSDPAFTYEFIEDGKIPFFEEENNEKRDFKQPGAVIEDKDGNIFVAGRNVAKIFKFTPDYKFIDSFGGKGLGPGEFEGGPSSLTYHRGQLLAPCWRNTSTNVYDTEGNFIKKIPPGVNAGFSGQLSFSDQILMNTESRKDDDSEAIVTSSVVQIDSNFQNIEKTIYSKDSRTLLRTFRISDMYVRFAAGKDVLYIGDVSENAYRIFGYDRNFKNTMEIRKKYRSVIEDDSMAVVYSFNPDNLGGSFYRKYNTNAKDRTLYYKSINHMFVDENDRLWVVSPTKNKKDQKGLYVDIFEKGIYLNTIYLPFYQSKDFSYVYSRIFLRNGKLFYVDNDNACIKVYTYTEKV